MEKIEICIGTYENLILGYRIQEKAEGGLTLESSFTTDSHRGALRCMAISPQGVLASTSTDDSIRLHSLRKRREVGSLFQHDGSVNCIRFFRGGHMFSASEDGTICLWKCKNWELMRLLKGHKGHVMAVAVHPSAKLGLSVGSDRAFFTWDLTTGKLAFKRKIEQVAHDILFTLDGNNYVLVYQRKVEVCSLEDTSVLQEINFDSRINSVCFVEDHLLAVGGDDGKVSVVDVITGDKLMHETFKGRIRSLCTLATTTDTFLFVAGSNGAIRVCKLDMTEDSQRLETVLLFDSGVRITCMTAYGPPDILKEVKKNEVVRDKRKRKKRMMEREKEDDGDDEDNDDEDKVHDEDDDEDNDDEDKVHDDEDSDRGSDSEDGKLHEDDVNGDAEEPEECDTSESEEEPEETKAKKRKKTLDKGQGKAKQKEVKNDKLMEKQKSKRLSRQKKRKTVTQ